MQFRDPVLGATAEDALMDSLWLPVATGCFLRLSLVFWFFMLLSLSLFIACNWWINEKKKYKTTILFGYLSVSLEPVIGGQMRKIVQNNYLIYSWTLCVQVLC